MEEHEISDERAEIVHEQIPEKLPTPEDWEGGLVHYYNIDRAQIYEGNNQRHIPSCADHWESLIRRGCGGHSCSKNISSFI